MWQEGRLWSLWHTGGSLSLSTWALNPWQLSDLYLVHISRHLLKWNWVDVEDILQLADKGELQIAGLGVSDWDAGGSADQQER